MTQTTTTVLLDAGGVILDEATQETARAGVITDVLAEIVDSYTTERYWADVTEAVACFSTYVYQYIFRKYCEPDIRLFNHLYDKHLDLWDDHQPPLELMEGIAPELKKMSGSLQIGLAGQYGRPVLDLLDKHDLLRFFTWRETQDDFNLTKPDPRYYEQIVGAFGVKPQECIMVGDRIGRDIVPARMLGMKTVRVRTGLHKNQRARFPLEIADAELPSVVGLAATAIALADSTG